MLMRVPIPSLSAFIVVPVWAMAALHAQITSNPIPAPVEKRGLAVEIRDVVRLPDTRGLRPLTEDVNPAGWARVSFVRDAPDGRRFANDSRGRLYLLDGGKSAVRLCRRRGDVPARRLQPPRERLHRLRLPSGVREERPVLHDPRRTGAGEPVDAQLHPAGVQRRRRELPQRDHGVACEEPGREHVRGQRGASSCASPTSCRR